MHATSTKAVGAACLLTVLLAACQPSGTPGPVGLSVNLAASRATLTAPGNVTLTATPSAAVTKVEFFEGATKLGEDTTAPYTFERTFAASATGTFSYTARAATASGQSATSAAVNVTVTPGVPGSVRVSGRVVVPTEFLTNGAETISFATLFQRARVWLFNPGGTATTSASIDANGAFTLDVPTNTPGQRLVAVFGSEADAPILAARLGALAIPDGAESLDLSLTLESTLADEIVRTPALRAAYEAELRAALAALPNPSTEAELNAAAFGVMGADWSSLADGRSGATLNGANALNALQANQVCTGWWIFQQCRSIPDLVLYGKRINSIFLPVEEVGRVRGSKIAPKVTFADPRVRARPDGGVRYSGVNGFIQRLNPLIGADGATLIGADGATLIGADGATFRAAAGYAPKAGESFLLSPTSNYRGALLVGNNGNTLVGNNGNTLVQRGLELINSAGSFVRTTTTRAFSAFKTASTSTPTNDAGKAKQLAEAALALMTPGNLQQPTITGVASTSNDPIRVGSSVRVSFRNVQAGDLLAWINEGDDPFSGAGALTPIPSTTSPVTVTLPNNLRAGRAVAVIFRRINPSAPPSLTNIAAYSPLFAFDIAAATTPGLGAVTNLLGTIQGWSNSSPGQVYLHNTNLSVGGRFGEANVSATGGFSFALTTPSAAQTRPFNIGSCTNNINDQLPANPADARFLTASLVVEQGGAAEVLQPTGTSSTTTYSFIYVDRRVKLDYTCSGFRNKYDLPAAGWYVVKSAPATGLTRLVEAVSPNVLSTSWTRAFPFE